MATMKSCFKSKSKSILINKIVLIVLSIIFLLSIVNTTSVKAQDINDDPTILSGSSNQTTLSSGHYQVNSDVTYSNGIIIPSGETVYIDIADGKTLTCNGIDAVQSTNVIVYYYITDNEVTSTPGITIEPGATLYLTGKGNVVAKGGNGTVAASTVYGSAQYEGLSVSYMYLPYFLADTIILSGGVGDYGATGAFAPSAGIGGSGGRGGKRTDSNLGDLDIIKEKETEKVYMAKSGVNGNNGANGESMGDLYVVDSVKITSTAGTNKTTPGQGGKFSSNPSSISSGGKNNSWHAAYNAGAPGGGGGISTPAAIIGGGGAGGGGGASGVSGSIWASRTDGVVGNTTSYSNGKDGTATSGGDGGLSTIVKASGYQDIHIGKGGKVGTSGEGGNLYITDTASVNGKLGTSLKQTDLGAETTESAGQGANVNQVVPIHVTVKKDNVLDSNQAITLVANGKEPVSLVSTQTGEYIGYVSKENVNYDIYVNGENSDYTVSANASSTNEINLYTGKVNVKLDGNLEEGHTVSLFQDGQQVYTLEESSPGVFTRQFLYKNPSSKSTINTYDIYVDGVDAKKQIEVAYNAEVTSNRYTAYVYTTLDDSPCVATAIPILKGDGKNIVLDETATTGTYKTILFDTDTTTYNIYIDTFKSDKTIKITSVKADREKTVPYFTATVNITKDGSACDNLSVNFKHGSTIYTVGGTAGTYTKILPVIYENNVEEPYTVETVGIIDSEVRTVKSTAKSFNLNLFTVNFMTTSDYDDVSKYNDKLHRSNIVVSGLKINSAVDPFLKNMTFVCWNTTPFSKGEGSQTGFDFSGTSITAKTTLYAHFIPPTVNINGYVKTDDSGVQSSEGTWFKMPNLSVTGYGNDADIKSIKITTTNQTATKLPADSNLVVTIDGTTQTPTGGWYSISGDHVILLTFTNKITAADAETYLRKVIVNPSTTTGSLINIVVSTTEMSGTDPTVITQTQAEDAPDPIELTGSGSTTISNDGYYYVSSDQTFSTTTANTSGLIINASDVKLVIPTGVTLTAAGGNASGKDPGGAGIEVPSGNTLRLYGKGTVTATGGNAANGSAGVGATKYSSRQDGKNYYVKNGASGDGGAGGGGAGAGIGGRGGAGGDGGVKNDNLVETFVFKVNTYGVVQERNPQDPIKGNAGTNGNPSISVGHIYVQNTLGQVVNGGDEATAQASAGAETERIKISSKTIYYAMQSGPGGGGGGGFAASNVGLGGPGGGGGGSGARGSVAMPPSTQDFGGSGLGGKGSKDGLNATINDYSDNNKGGAGGEAGGSGSTGTIATMSGSTNNISFPVTFTGASTDATNYYFYVDNQQVSVPDYTPEVGKVFLGWKVSQYGRNVSGNHDTSPLTSAEKTLYLPGSTIALDIGTYGSIILNPIVDDIPSKSASDTLNINSSDFSQEQTLYTYTINTTLDGSAANIGSIKLVDSTSPTNTFDLSSTSTGKYVFESGQDKTFKIYIDNKDTGKTITKNTAQTIAMKTLKVQVNKDGEGTADLGTITLKNNSTVLTLDTNYDLEGKATGLFTKKLLDTEALDEYNILVNGTDTGLKVSPSTLKEINYYTLTVNTKKDDTLTNINSVTLRDNSGNIKYSLTNNEAGKYTYTSLENSTNYKIYVGEDDTGLTASLNEKTTKDVNYYTVTVKTKIDNSLADMGTVKLSDGTNELTLPQTSEGVYSLTKLADDTTYKVYVGGQDISKNVKFSSDSSLRTVEVNFGSLSLTTKLDGTTSNVGLITLKKDGNKDITLDYQSDKYVATTLNSGTYDVYLDGKDLGKTIVTGTPSTLNFYTLKYDLNGGEGFLAEDKVYVEGTSVSLPVAIPTKNDSQFIGWKYGETVIKPKEDGTFDPISINNDNRNLKAEWVLNSDQEVRYSVDDTNWTYTTLSYALGYAGSLTADNTNVHIILQKDITIDKNIPTNVILDIPEGMTLSGDFENKGTINCEGTINSKVTNSGIIYGKTINADTSVINEVINNKDSIIKDITIDTLISNLGTLKNVTINSGTSIGGKLEGSIYAESGVTFNPDVNTIYFDGGVKKSAEISLVGGGTINDIASINNSDCFAGLMNAVTESEVTRYSTQADIVLRSKLTVKVETLYTSFFDIVKPSDLKYDGQEKTVTFNNNRTQGLGEITGIRYRYKTGTDTWSDWSTEKPKMYNTYEVQIDVADGQFYNGTANSGFTNGISDSDVWKFRITPNPIPDPKAGEMPYDEGTPTVEGKGFNATVTKFSATDKVARIKNAFIADTVEISESGTPLTATTDYEVTQSSPIGSLVITLKANYINGLSHGTHTLNLRLTQDGIAKDYKITIVVNSYTDITLSQTSATTKGTEKLLSVEAGKTMPSATMPSKTGYNFNGYWDDETSEISPAIKYYNANGTSAHVWNKDVLTSTLYAHFNPVTYTVKYDANGGTGTEMDTSTFTYDSEADTLNKNTYTRTGYTFSGWAKSKTATTPDFVDEQTGIKFNLKTTQGDEVTLYAVWTANQYTVALDANGGTPGLKTQVTTTYDAAMPSLTSTDLPTKDYYSFNGYYDAATGGTKYYNENGTSSHKWDKDNNTTTLYAQYIRTKVQDIKANRPDINMQVNNDTTVKVTITPINAYKGLIVNSADTNVATATYDQSKGEIAIHGVTQGKTTITVKADDESISPKTITINVSVSSEHEDPIIIEGHDYVKGSKESTLFKSNDELDHFLDLTDPSAPIKKANSEVILDKDTTEEQVLTYLQDYSVEEGSIKVFINSNISEKLPYGEHTLTIKSDNGEATTTFKVAKESKPSPDPGRKDESCEKVLGPYWHWNNNKGICEEIYVVGTYTR